MNVFLVEDSAILLKKRLSTLSGIVRAALNRSYDARDGNTREKWEARLQQIFFAFSAARPDYTSVRYSGWRIG